MLPADRRDVGLASHPIRLVELTGGVELFSVPLTGIESAWAACAERMGRAGHHAAAPLAGTIAGREPLGTGGGGDVTIALDQKAEDAMLAVLRAEAPAPYRLVAEEAGVQNRPGAGWTVLVDPVDGSLNAKRGLEPFSGVVAVASGTTLGTVKVGFTEDYARGHVYLAVQGRGIVTSREFGESGTITRPIKSDGTIEVLLLEAGSPGQHSFCFSDLALGGVPGLDPQVRVRQIGSLALSLCNIALGVGDVLVAPTPSRSVDIAAGLLLVVEAGGGAASLDGSDLWAQPLDLERRSPFVAWRAGVESEAVVPVVRRLLMGLQR